MAVKLDANKVREAKKELGFSQKILAEAASVSTTTAWKAENGEAMSLFVAKSICEVVGLDPLDTIIWADELVTEERLAKCRRKKTSLLSNFQKAAERSESRGELFQPDAARELLKPQSDTFNVGDTVVVYVSFGLTLKEKRQGKIIAKHKKFALVDLGKYQESFAYMDMQKIEGKGRKAI